MLIKKYNPVWIDHFNQLKSTLEAGLPGLDIKIEHVGSTAVPDLDGKDIIDIDIIFYEAPDFQKIKAGLSEMGYYHNGDQGITHREVFKRTGTPDHPVLDTIVHHLYVCPHHSPALREHLLFRDYLIINAQWRQQYQQKKYELATQANQQKQVYAELKEQHLSDFIKSIVNSGQ